MTWEYTAQVENFISTVLVDNWKGTDRTARMNTADYRAERDGSILEGPTLRENTPGTPVLPLKDPKVDEHGNAIAGQASPMLRAGA
jgi:hypothetical protein